MSITITMSKFCQYIPLPWLQKPHKNGSSSTSNISSNDDGSPTKIGCYRDSKATSGVQKRQRTLCHQEEGPGVNSPYLPQLLAGP